MDIYRVYKAAETSLQYTPLNISEFFNNCALTNANDLNVKDKYDGISGTKIKSESFNFGINFSLDNMSFFEISPPNSKSFDNIVPEGQVLDGFNVEIDRILLFGFSEWIDADFEYSIICENGEEEICKGYLYGITLNGNKPLIKENIIIEYKEWGLNRPTTMFQFARDCHGVESVGYMHCTEHVLSSSKKIKSIRLPDNELLHIFAISVGIATPIST